MFAGRSDPAWVSGDLELKLLGWVDFGSTPTNKLSVHHEPRASNTLGGVA